MLGLLLKPGSLQIAKLLKTRLYLLYTYITRVPAQFCAAAVRCGLFDWRAAHMEKMKLLQWLSCLLQLLWEETYP